MSQVGTDCQDTADAVGFEIQNHARHSFFSLLHNTTFNSFFLKKSGLFKSMPQEGYKKKKKKIEANA